MLLSLAISLGVTPLVRRLARGAGLLDVPIDSRRVHSSPIPRIGGIAIVTAFCATLAVAFVLPQTRDAMRGYADDVGALALAGLAVAALGLWDDVRGLGPRPKLAVEIVVALILYAAGFRIETVTVPFASHISLGVMSLPVTVLWITGVANAFNLSDGLDGLAGGIALVGAVAVFEIAAVTGEPFTMIVALAVVGAVTGFLFYNVTPASIFMGDTGSLFLGTVLAALTTRVARPLGAVPVLGVAVLLAIPIADTLLAMIRRTARGVPMFMADREHVHHRLLERGMSQRWAVVTLWAASALLACAGVHSVTTRSPYALVAVAMLGTAALAALGYARLPEREALRRRRLQNKARLKAVADLSRRLRGARSQVQVAREVACIAPWFDAAAVSIRRRHHRPSRPGPAEVERVALFPIDSLGEAGCVEMRGLREPLTGDADVAARILCREVAVALQRVDRGPVDVRRTSIGAMRRALQRAPRSGQMFPRSISDDGSPTPLQ